jgi:hypothetical protein
VALGNALSRAFRLARVMIASRVEMKNSWNTGSMQAFQSPSASGVYANPSRAPIDARDARDVREPYWAAHPHAPSVPKRKRACGGNDGARFLRDSGAQAEAPGTGRLVQVNALTQEARRTVACRNVSETEIALEKCLTLGKQRARARKASREGLSGPAAKDVDA